MVNKRRMLVRMASLSDVVVSLLPHSHDLEALTASVTWVAMGPFHLSTVCSGANDGPPKRCLTMKRRIDLRASSVHIVDTTECVQSEVV